MKFDLKKITLRYGGFIFETGAGKSGSRAGRFRGIFYVALAIRLSLIIAVGVIIDARVKLDIDYRFTNQPPVRSKTTESDKTKKHESLSAGAVAPGMSSTKAN